MRPSPIEAGKTYEVECPYVRTTYDHYEHDGEDFSCTKRDTWKPGVEWEANGPESDGPFADGVGKVLYTVVSVHELPKPYKARVFFVREWIDPDGKKFGKRTLRIMGIGAFQQRLNGYRFGGYEDGFEMRQQSAAA